MNTALLLVMALAAPDTRGISGRVVGPDGQGVADAIVYHVAPLVSGIEKPVCVEAKTGDDGAFHFDEGAIPGDIGASSKLFPRGSLLAYSPGLALGSVFLPGNHNLYRLTAEPPPRQFEIRLERPTPIEIEVLSPSGEPLSLASVRFELFGRAPRSAWPGDYQAFISLPDSIAEKLANKTDDSGRVTIPFLSPDDTLGLAIESSEYGPMHAFVSGRLPGRQIKLPPAGSIEGQVIAGDAEAVKKLRISIYSLPANAYGSLEATRNPFGSSSRIETTTDDEGRFSVPKVGAGVVSFYVQTGEASEWQSPANATAISVAPGKTAAVEVPLVRAARLTGRVVDDETGDGLAGIPLRAGQRDVVTDMEGRFQVLSTSEPLWVEFVSLPSPWLTPTLAPGEFPFVVQFAPGIVAEAPEYRLKKGRPLSGTVVNENGEPVVGAHVSASFTIGAGRGAQPIFQHDSALTDELGRFTLLRTNPAGVTVLEARTAERALVEPMTCDSSDPDDPRPKLVVSPKGMVTLAGRIIDATGKSVAAAQVHVSQSYNWKSDADRGAFSAPLLSDIILTDAEGRFETAELLPRTRKYRLDVVARGALPANTEFLDFAKDDPVLRTPDIVLNPVSEVRGIVVDAKGAPIVGAIVWSPHGGESARDKIQITTNEEGGFLLAGLHPRALLLFAEADGFTMAGAAANLGEVARIVLDRPEEQAKSPPLVARQRPLDDRKRWLRELTEAMAPVLKERFGEELRYSIVKTTARIDRERALKLSAGLPDHRRIEIQASQGESKDALRALAAIDKPARRFEAALGIAGAATDAEDRKMALSEALASAWRLAGPAEQAMALAKVAQSYLDRGEREMARAVADEAREIVNGLPADDRSQQCRATVAGILAFYDSEAALKLILSLSDETSRRISLGNTAIALASSNPMEAEVFYNAIEQEMDDKSVAKRVSYRFAGADFDRAKRFLDRALARSSSTDMIRADYLNRAQACGAMATCVFKRDPAAAKALLREAMDQVHPETPTYVEGDLIGTAFALLAYSQTIDPTASEEYFWRALACHRLRAFRPLDEDPSDHENAAKLVLFCLCYDRLPELRSHVMEPIFQFWEAAKRDDRSSSRHYRSAIFVAMLLTDPDRTIRWAKSYLSAEPKGLPRYERSPWLEMVDALAYDGPDLPRILSGRVYQVWAPMDER